MNFALGAVPAWGEPLVPPLTATQLTTGVERTVLANGLTVLTKEVHTAPVVTVQVWQPVGSAQETPTTSGLAHQLEHLLFRGTEARPVPFGQLLQALGSQFNAFTSFDATTYVTTISREKLGAVLALEADRLSHTQITAAQLDPEQRVVLAELAGYLNSPGYRLSQALRQAMYPPAEGILARLLPTAGQYGLPVGGTPETVAALSVETVREFYQHHYQVGQTTLVLVGDFETQAALALVRSTFGDAPPDAPTKAPVPRRSAHVATLAKPQASAAPLRLTDPAAVPTVTMLYPAPPVGDPEAVAFDLLDAILTGGRTSRLYQSLVETGRAAGVGGSPSHQRGAGWYQLRVVAGTDSLDDLQGALEAELGRLQTELVSEAELKRVQQQLVAGTTLAARSISAQAQQLGYAETVVGDYRWGDRYLEQAIATTPADLKRVALRYLNLDHRQLGFLEPAALGSDQRPPAASEVPETTTLPHTYEPSEPLDLARLQPYLPPITAGNAEALDREPQLPVQRQFANGLTVLVLPDGRSPTVTLVGELRAGGDREPAAQAGLASLTAGNLTQGTQQQSGLEFAQTLADRGAQLGFRASQAGVSLGGQGLAQDLPLLVKQLAAALRTPTFPAASLARQQQRIVTSLRAGQGEPGAVAGRALQTYLYPADHPYHAVVTPETIMGIGPEDVRQFHQRYYRPDQLVLAVVGDVDPEVAIALIESELGDWSVPGRPTRPRVAPIPPRTRAERRDHPLPDKGQAVILFAQPGISRLDPRYETALVLNEIIGGNTLSSRLGLVIRDQQGLTYGIYSRFQTGETMGSFSVSLQTAPDQIDTAIDQTLGLLRQVKTQGVTAAELAWAKASLRDRFPLSIADPDALAQGWVRRQMLGMPLADLYRFPDRVEAVTLEDVNDFAQTVLQPETMLVITAGSSPASGQEG